MNGGKGVAGAFYGNPGQLGVQALAAGLTMVLSFGGTWLIFKAIDVIQGVRVNEKDEAIGLDITQHNERAYTVIE